MPLPHVTLQGLYSDHMLQPPFTATQTISNYTVDVACIRVMIPAMVIIVTITLHPLKNSTSENEKPKVGAEVSKAHSEHGSDFS